MDIFEKEQTIDSVRGIVRVRWINIILVVSLCFVLKIKYLTGEWAQGFEYFKIIAMAAFAFGYNFTYWLFIRRPIEKISDKALAIVAALQVVVDQIMYTLIFYYTGTVETIAFILYFLTILIASSLYKTRGIILSSLLAIILHNSILILEFKKLIPHLTAYTDTVWFGNPYVTRGKIIGFTFYMACAVVFSAFLSNLFRKRIKILSQQRDKLTEQSQILSQQTQELTQTKNLLQDALIKSDKARAELIKAKEKLEKANLELKKKIEELENFYRITIGREVKMVELKKEIKTLKETIKKLEEELAKKK